MNNQDLAQSGTGVTHTPYPGAAEEAETPVTAAAAPLAEGTSDTLVEVENMPKGPAASEDDGAAKAQGAPLNAAPNVAHDPPPPLSWRWLDRLSPFWHDRLIEAGLILSMGLYYLVGNPHFGEGSFLHLPPYLYSLPFLVIFAVLTWYRLAFTVALMPLALPYYYLAPKAIFSLGTRNFEFSLAEITLAVCVLVALGQLLMYGKRWRYRLTWTQVRAYVGPFLMPIAVFFGAALISVAVAVEHQTAFRAFHEEIVAPLLYGLLALCCLRTRQDLKRLLWAFLGSAMIIALAGLIQYFFFANQLQGAGADRVHAMYGSANSIGLFFDYALPFGMALLILQVSKTSQEGGRWWPSLLLLAGFVPLVGVLVFSQSLGSALALPIALLFILALSLRSRKTLLIGAGVLLVVGLGGGLLLRHQIAHFLATWHDSSRGISTITKRYYLWQSALHMIQHHPWFGVGMDNWLCYYSPNSVCPASQTIYPHFWIPFVPGTHQLTGLSDEPTLSHPHDIFLHVWVSMGIFGLLAFVAVLALFYWLFARIVRTVRQSTHSQIASLEWMVLGVGGAMLAALCQGLIDSSFLEQDLAFCFWTLVAILLILRMLTNTPWRKRPTN
jgi:putative inorganic carbon (HCO3(-)) transporter